MFLERIVCMGEISTEGQGLGPHQRGSILGGCGKVGREGSMDKGKRPRVKRRLTRKKMRGVR